MAFFRWAKCLTGLLLTLSVAGSTSIGTTTQQSEPLQKYVCTKEGRFRNRTDPNKYVTCTLDVAGGGFMKEAGSCPTKAFYNQRLDACVITLRTTTARPTTAQESSSEEPVTAKPTFKCTAAGRFPNPFTCHGYYMCYEDTDGTPYGPYEYSCPPYKHFSPTAKRCAYASMAGCVLGL